jgi:hypothetical protein
MATLRERLRARREAERRKLPSFTIGVSEDDLRVIAKHACRKLPRRDEFLTCDRPALMHSAWRESNR